MNRGIILIACGHQYYGNYAFQLAVSIKSVSPETNISIIHSGNGLGHLTDGKRKIFDKIIKLEEEDLIGGKLNSVDYFRVKTLLYELSPYDTTLYLDSDMLWLPNKNITQLFEEFKEVKFTMSNRGCSIISEAQENFIQWAKSSEIKKEYGFTNEKLYNLSSEFIYFKKDGSVERLFQTALEIFDSPKVKYQIFGDNQPDELCFCIAMMKEKLYPHKENFLPAYWEAFMRKRLQSKEMYEQYYLSSFGGAFQDKPIIEFYNNLANYYMRQRKENYFPLKSKREWLKTRLTI